MATYLLNNADAALKAYQYTGFSVTVNASFTVPDMGGVAWNGTDVIYGGGSVGSTNSIKKGTGFTATVSASFNGPVATERTWDLHNDASNNVYIVINTAKTYRMNGFSSTVSASFSLGGGNTSRGVSFDGTDTYIFAAGVGKNYKMSGFSSTISDSFAGVTNQRSVAWNSTDAGLITGSSTAGTAKFRQHSGFSSTVTSSVSQGAVAGSLGIFWDAGSAAGPTTVKTFDGVTQSTGIKTYWSVALASTKSVDGLT